MVGASKKTCSETILDPFMGSGTTGAAAVKAEDSSTLEERYFEIACKRIQQALQQPTLHQIVQANPNDPPALTAPQQNHAIMAAIAHGEMARPKRSPHLDHSFGGYDQTPGGAVREVERTWYGLGPVSNFLYQQTLAPSRRSSDRRRRSQKRWMS